jgi:hypothetical protein
MLVGAVFTLPENRLPPETSFSKSSPQRSRKRKIQRKGQSKCLELMASESTTGGTYTDAVVYDFETKRILGCAKALTTSGMTCRAASWRRWTQDPALVHRAGMVDAFRPRWPTNACVEGKGGRRETPLHRRRSEDV